MSSESSIVASVRLALQKLKVTTFRNQVGALQDAQGRWVRFGLCPGSSDFIGWHELVIGPEHIGRQMAVFTAIETKRPKGGVRSPDQIAFISRVQLAGGIAGFASSAKDAETIMNLWRDQL